MEHLYDINKEEHSKLMAFSKKCSDRHKEQSTLASYHTTKFCQRMMIESFEHKAPVLEHRNQAMKLVISESQRQIRKNYIRRVLNHNHEHCESSSIKKEFLQAEKPLRKLEEQLEKLIIKEKSVENVLSNIAEKRRVIAMQEPVDEAKLASLRQQKRKNRELLQRIQSDMLERCKEIKNEKKSLSVTLQMLHRRCADLEAECSNFIYKMTLEFLKTLYTTQQAIDLDGIYSNLRTKIEETHDAEADLTFWSTYYGPGK